jgi:Tfp pilus assembly protein PilP
MRLIAVLVLSLSGCAASVTAEVKPVVRQAMEPCRGPVADVPIPGPVRSIEALAIYSNKLRRALTVTEIYRA